MKRRRRVRVCVATAVVLATAVVSETPASATAPDAKSVPRSASMSTTIGVAPAPLPATAGPVTYAVTVSGTGATPTGSVTVSDSQGGSCVAVPLNAGAAQCVMNQSAGSSPYTITASYSGDVTYSPDATQIVVVGAVSSDGAATAVNGGLSVTATGGTGTVTATVYPSEPVPARSFDGTGYFDVALASPNVFTSVAIRFCDPGVSSTDTLFWWDSPQRVFMSVNPIPAYTPASQFSPDSCLSVPLDNNTTPNLTQLTGTVFGVAPPTKPSIPRSVSAVPGNGQATVHWRVPLSNGGNQIIHFVVTAYLAGKAEKAQAFNQTAVSGVMTPLTNAKSYTFKVIAQNTVGSSGLSAPTNAVIVGSPTAPSGVHATPAGAGQLNVTFTLATNNGARITSYTANCTSTNGGVTRIRFGPASPITVTGLSSANKTYTCTVRATNNRGTGPPSSPSPAINT